MSEADYQKRITDYCDLLGLKWHHETDSRKTKSGWPDLVIAGPGAVIFAELKKQNGRVSASQQEWLDKLSGAGARVYVWRPSDWEQVEKTLRNLR